MGSNSAIFTSVSLLNRGKLYKRITPMEANSSLFGRVLPSSEAHRKSCDLVPFIKTKEENREVPIQLKTGINVCNSGPSCSKHR